MNFAVRRAKKAHGIPGDSVIHDCTDTGWEWTVLSMISCVQESWPGLGLVKITEGYSQGWEIGIAKDDCGISTEMCSRMRSVVGISVH